MLRIPISTHERILTPFKTSDGSELRTAADEVELALGGRLPPPVIRALVVPDGCGADSTEKVGMSEDVNIVIDDGETEREERVVVDVVVSKESWSKARQDTQRKRRVNKCLSK